MTAFRLQVTLPDALRASYEQHAKAVHGLDLPNLVKMLLHKDYSAYTPPHETENR
jgi:hypothetical protein